jgi:hypothetical protein
MLDYEDEKLLLDTGPPCTASGMACRFLKAHGYERVRRYIRGLEKCEGAGYPLEANTPDSRPGYLHHPLTNMRSGGERGGELEALLHQELRSFADWFWRE